MSATPIAAWMAQAKFRYPSSFLTFPSNDPKREAILPDFDAFNGDADGICALHQLRLAEPRAATLVTGIKRDISLLKRVIAGAGDRVTALDISLNKNREPLQRLLDAGAQVEYFDHHQADDIPDHPNFHAHIDTSAEVCTSLLVNRHLGGKHLIWAVVAAFGDNLAESARRAAEPLALAAGALAELQELGECINYNAYGEAVADLYFDPAELYRLIHAHGDPFTFIREDRAFAILKRGYAEDMAQAKAIQGIHESDAGLVFALPDAAWSRRVSGVFGNWLATQSPQRAHAVLTQKSDGAYLVSVRAPLALKAGADVLCSQFETGGGRKGAAGINHLPDADVPRFLAAFDEVFSKNVGSA
jgi:hypothetical protein